MTLLETHLRETHVPAAAFVPAMQSQAVVDPIAIEDEREGDAEARESLLDRAFGPARFAKTCERLRAGRLPAAGLSLVARVRALGGGVEVGQIGGQDLVGQDLVGTVRLWHVDAGGVPALMLGPLAVDARYRNYGIGARLMEDALDRAAALGHAAVLLVGDAPYYARFGFERRHTRGLRLPGPVEAERFLGLEVTPGAFAGAEGLVRPTGALDLGARRQRRKMRRAA